MLWHELKKAVHARTPCNVAEFKQMSKEKWVKILPSHDTDHPRKLQQLRDAIMSVWITIFNSYFQHFVESMPLRIREGVLNKVASECIIYIKSLMFQVLLSYAH